MSGHMRWSTDQHMRDHMSLNKNETDTIKNLKYLLNRKIAVVEPLKRLVSIVCGELYGSSQCKKINKMLRL